MAATINWTIASFVLDAVTIIAISCVAALVLRAARGFGRILEALQLYADQTESDVKTVRHSVKNLHDALAYRGQAVPRRDLERIALLERTRTDDGESRDGDGR